ncbi:MipA/OmpV family protein [Stenotrophomonas sp. 24(2023)]|uniref:MipA/OmpV family protein n=1 Tax=Stenotrophomonas sp. 24(2023) TaxID=3068324 RepID=UPI0027E0F446|nr:MipA/OmpV family protein [Stenotrophomonas sp. 24(2023)]WMJ70268.1 MipA/OmpV family protein [Stenotrophomonas sp. 24(2023)]
MSPTRRPALPFLLLSSLLALPLTGTAADTGASDRWTKQLSVGGGVAPRYSGSKDYQAVPMLSFEATSPGGWFLGTGGVGWSTTVAGRASLRGYVSASNSRRDKDAFLEGSDHLRGMGRIRSRAMVGVAGSYVVGTAVLTAGLQYTPRDSDRGDNGLATGHAVLGVDVPLFALAGGKLSATGSAEYGNKGYMQTWYGVTAAQSASSGFRAFTPKAGFHSAGLGLTWRRELGARSDWFISVEGARLLGDAADSPIVQKANQFTAISGYNRRF